jgi:alkanesulfonate monooxygenase SsuD/methylene tetrahydromethanopterin reductase-like flavin-dependent oxidoreductase (luciferase family)
MFCCFEQCTEDNEKEGEAEDDESPVAMLKELLKLAQEDLEMARKNSTRLAEKARKMAERSLVLRDEAADAERAALNVQAEIDDVLQQESEGKEEMLSTNYI